MGLWIVSIPIFFIFAWIAISNLMIVLRFYLYGKHGSMFPILGGIIGVFGMCFTTEEIVKSYWWVPLVLDPGSLPWIVMVIVFLVTGKYKKHK